MLKVYKSLSESFSDPYPISKTSSSDAFYFSMPGLAQFKFQTEDGSVYVIVHSHNPMTISSDFNEFRSNTLGRIINFYTLDFIKILDPSKSFSPSNTTQDLDASHNFMKVFSTVIYGALEYYSSKKVDIVGISGKDSE